MQPYSLDTSARIYTVTMAAFKAQDAGNIALMRALDEERRRMLLFQAPSGELEKLLAEAASLKLTPAPAYATA